MAETVLKAAKYSAVFCNSDDAFGIRSLYRTLPLPSVQESRAVARKPRDAAAVLFGLKFADIIHYKFKSSQASKAMLQSSKHSGVKQNLTQNGHSRSFKVTCFGVRGKAIRD